MEATTLEFQINGGCQISGVVRKFLKINKQGGANNFWGGQNIPENCTNIQKSAFLKFQIRKIKGAFPHLSHNLKVCAKSDRSNQSRITRKNRGKIAILCIHKSKLRNLPKYHSPPLGCNLICVCHLICQSNQLGCTNISCLPDS